MSTKNIFFFFLLTLLIFPFTAFGETGPTIMPNGNDTVPSVAERLDTPTLFVFTTYILRSFFALFWGVFLLFFSRRSKQNLPLSCIFIIIGLLYMLNSFKRFPSMEVCDVYNVRSYLTLIFIAPFTIFYAYFAMGEKHSKRHYLLHFIPFGIMLLLWIALRLLVRERIPACYDLNRLLGYFREYPLYVGYFVLLLAVFVTQVFTYFGMALKRILRVRKIHRALHFPMDVTNKLLAMDFLFLYYPLFCMVFMSYNNNMTLGVANNFSIFIIITVLSILNMKLTLPVKITAEELNNVEIQHIEDKTLQSVEKEMSARLMQKIRQLFEEEKVYMQQQLSLSDIATRLHTNRTYVSAAINKHAHCSFNEFVTNYRIATAKQMLLESDMDVQDIAWETGFNNRASFYNAFKKYVCKDLSPVEWRGKVKIRN